MEILSLDTFTFESSRAFALKQPVHGKQVPQTLLQIQARIPSHGKSKISGKSALECIRELGMTGYLRELRLDELRAYIRERVVYNIGITKIKYDYLRNNILGLKANRYLRQAEAGRINRMAADLADGIEKEVKRRLLEHLAAEAMAGKEITRTLAYDNSSEEYRAALSELAEMLRNLVEEYGELKKGEAERRKGRESGMNLIRFIAKTFCGN
jgi:hypothetical protein